MKFWPVLIFSVVACAPEPDAHRLNGTSDKNRELTKADPNVLQSARVQFGEHCLAYDLGIKITEDPIMGMVLTDAEEKSLQWQDCGTQNPAQYWTFNYKYTSKEDREHLTGILMQQDDDTGSMVVLQKIEEEIALTDPATFKEAKKNEKHFGFKIVEQGQFHFIGVYRRGDAQVGCLKADVNSETNPLVYVPVVNEATFPIECSGMTIELNF